MRVLFVCSVDNYLLSHRKELLLACLERKYEVHVLSKFGTHRAYLESLGVKTHAFNVSRAGGDLFTLVREIFKIIKAAHEVKPDVLHLIALKLCVIGGLASIFQRSKKVILALSGFGYVFTHESIPNLLRRFMIKLALRCIGKLNSSRFLCQNPDDLDYLRTIVGIKESQLVLIAGGSGVNLSTFSAKPREKIPFRVMYVGRLLWTKGVRELIEAATLIKSNTRLKDQIKISIYGAIDEGNPASLSSKEFLEITGGNVVDAYGWQNNIEQIMAQGHVLIVPSYREGFPRVIVEAAACGTPVISFDVIGCRDAVIDGETGFLVPKGDVLGIARCVEKLFDDRELWRRMSVAARDHAIANFGVQKIIDKHLKLYEE